MENVNAAAQLMSVLYNILVMWLTSTVILLAYAYRSNKAEFDLFCWFVTNKNRFAVGALMIVALATLVVIEPDISAVLQVIGFSAEKTPIGLGVAVGAFLIAGISGNNPNPENEQ
jgi:hypothetical protein